MAVTSANAAKIYNLYPRKGRIIPGADADVVVWDPEGSKYETRSSLSSSSSSSGWRPPASLRLRRFSEILCLMRAVALYRTISVDSQVQGGDVNLYEGLRCHGVPLVTISRGRLVYENEMFTCAEGSGKFCPMRTFPDYLYKKMVQRAKV